MGSVRLGLGRFWVVVAVCAGAGGCVASLGSANAAAPGAVTFAAGRAAAAGTWGSAQEVPGLGALATEGFAQILSVSCASPGNCAVGGWYVTSPGVQQGFVADEVNGVWRDAGEVPALGALNSGGDAQVQSVSCASAGNCVAGGWYQGTSLNQGFVASEVNGVWGDAIEVPGLSVLDDDGTARVLSASCGSAGNCIVGGWYMIPGGFSQGFVASEVNGIWGNAESVPGLAALESGPIASGQVISVSCGSAGNCVAAGWYGGGATQGFVADEVSGTWDDAEEVPGLGSIGGTGSARVLSVSCAAAGNCTAGGFYDTALGFVASEVNGTWENAEEVPGLGSLLTGASPAAEVTSVSCGSAGNCAAVGGWNLGSARQSFAASEVNGKWGDAEQVPGLVALDVGNDADVLSVSCGSADNCAAAGYYTNASQRGFVVNQVDGAWGVAQEVPGLGALSTAGAAEAVSVSCGHEGGCAAGGYYTYGTGQHQGFVADKAPPAGKADSTTTLALSAPGVSYGDEKSETFSVTVSGKSVSGKPAGSVTVSTGDVKLCTITLVSGAGSCPVPDAVKLHAGDYVLVARYGGDSDFLPSDSAAAAFTVTRASTTIAVTVMAKVIYGAEQAAVITVKVKPEFAGTPEGTVAVKSGTAPLCTITLVSGGGSCELLPTSFSVGSYRLTASYRGNADFTSSTGIAKVKVASASTKTTLKLSAATITHGHEEHELISVTVSPQFLGMPAGTVRVFAGKTSICTIKLARAKGSCKLTASQLPAGRYLVTASYSGDRNFSSSTSAGSKLTVKP